MTSGTPSTASATPSDRLVVMTEPDSEQPSTPDQGRTEPEGKVYRASRRPGLTTPGVAVIGSAIALLAAVVSMLLTDGIGWVFGVPFVLVSAYCAWEVRGDSLRAALIMPPLALLLVAGVVPVIFGDAQGLRDWILRILTVLTKLAPMLIAAVAASGGILAWRRWGNGPK